MNEVQEKKPEWQATSSFIASIAFLILSVLAWLALLAKLTRSICYDWCIIENLLSLYIFFVFVTNTLILIYILVTLHIYSKKYTISKNRKTQIRIYCWASMFIMRLILYFGL